LNYRLIGVDGQVASTGVMVKNKIVTRDLPDGLYVIQLIAEDTFYLGKFVKH